MSLRTVARASERCRLIFVSHPQTRHKLSLDPEGRKLLAQERIEIRDRMPFSEFIGLLQAAEFLISDGGSNQEECSYLGKPCLLMREATERQEGLDGCCVLSRFDQRLIDRFLKNPNQYRRPGAHEGSSPSDIIIKSLSSF